MTRVHGAPLQALLALKRGQSVSFIDECADALACGRGCRPALHWTAYPGTPFKVAERAAVSGEEAAAVPQARGGLLDTRGCVAACAASPGCAAVGVVSGGDGADGAARGLIEAGGTECHFEAGALNFSAVPEPTNGTVDEQPTMLVFRRVAAPAQATLLAERETQHPSRWAGPLLGVGLAVVGVAAAAGRALRGWLWHAWRRGRGAWGRAERAREKSPGPRSCERVPCHRAVYSKKVSCVFLTVLCMPMAGPRSVPCVAGCLSGAESGGWGWVFTRGREAE